MSKVDEALAGYSTGGRDDCVLMERHRVRSLLRAAWHLETADLAITSGDIQVAKDCIKDAIAAVKEFNQ